MNFKKTKWLKKGLVIKPDEKIWWMTSYAMVPTPQKIEGSLYRIYFAGRNNKNQSHIGYALIDIAEPDKVLEYSAGPVMVPGALGAFDDNGVLPSCIVQNGHQTFLYYIGFKPGGTTRMDLFGGLAISEDGGKSFERWSQAPVIERCRVNPFINTAPFVIRQGELWRMFYVAGVEWVNRDLPRYNIQTALSKDGKEWKREGDVAIDFANHHENALARPYVVEENGHYRMWFSSKGDFYLPRYAESDDGVIWKRYDNAVDMMPSPGGPDSEMICYPIVLSHQGRDIMYYNGNGYGLNGVCLAVEE